MEKQCLQGRRPELYSHLLLFFEVRTSAGNRPDSPQLLGSDAANVKAVSALMQVRLFAIIFLTDESTVPSLLRQQRSHSLFQRCCLAHSLKEKSSQNHIPFSRSFCCNRQNKKPIHRDIKNQRELCSRFKMMKLMYRL